MSVNGISLVAAVACAGMLAFPAHAQAQATDAVQGCGATNVTSSGATVPTSNQSAEIFRVNTDDGSFPIRCGNGTTYGAVHIEVKHNVPTWGDALSCITKAINRTTGNYDASTGKTTYTYQISGGTVIVVRGGVGIITAYPRGSGVEQKWQTCSVS